MVADKTQKGSSSVENDRPFRVENNVLIGKSLPCETNYTHVGKLILDRMRSHLNTIGQVDAVTNESETFGDMLDRAIKCALWLKKQGIRQDDVIAISTDNNFNCFVPCLASLFIGSISTTWDHQMNTQAARHFMSLSQPKIIFANETSAGVIIDAAKIELHDVTLVVFGDYSGGIAFSEILQGHSKSDIENFSCTEIKDPYQTASILYSSGTTGLPKGVQLSHYGLLQHLEVSEGLDLRGKTALWFSTLYWISGLLLTLQSLSSCTMRIVCPPFEEELACKIIEKFKVTWVFLSTSMGNRFVRSKYVSQYDLSSLQFIFIGGAVLTRQAQELLRKHLPHAMIVQAYGMTELGGLAINQLCDSSSGSCGVVSRNAQLKIVDTETGKTLGPNQSGELYVKTLTMTTGYYRNPKATKETIDEDGWLHSGDLAYYNDKYEVYIIERLKELIKYRGYHVTPSEIEDVLQGHPAVMEVAVVSMPHLTDDEHPIAFVSKVPGSTVTEQELIDLVASNLMDHSKLRGGVKFLESLPHTPSGKISRKELKAIAKTLAVS